MVLLRKVIGDALRAKRLAQHRTLREVSTAANVSLGYLSEIERGHKEASSELLASICDALGAPLSEMLGEVSATFALAEQMEEAFANSPALADEKVAVPVADEARVPAVTNSLVPVGARSAEEPDLEVTDGDVTVQVRSDGPLRTTLTARRAAPGQRHVDQLLV
jgi:XRE family transcriptional regulator, stress-response regulator